MKTLEQRLQEVEDREEIKELFSVGLQLCARSAPRLDRDSHTAPPFARSGRTKKSWRRGLMRSSESCTDTARYCG